MALKLGELVANWRQTYPVKEGAEPPAFTMSILAWWIRSATALSSLVVNVGFNDHLGRVIVILSHQELESLSELVQASLEAVYEDRTDPRLIIGEIVGNKLIFELSKKDLTELAGADCLKLNLQTAA